MEGSAGSLVGGRKSRTWAKKAQKLRNFSRESERSFADSTLSSKLFNSSVM